MGIRRFCRSVVKVLESKLCIFMPSQISCCKDLVRVEGKWRKQAEDGYPGMDSIILSSLPKKKGDSEWISLVVSG